MAWRGQRPIPTWRLNMWRRSLPVLVVGILSLSFGQSLMNGYGIGQRNPTLNVSSMAKGSFGLTPDFSADVAINNPATWHYLRFTYVQNEYAGRQISSGASRMNRSSGFNRTQVIIPVKRKFSFGLSLSPYTSRQILLATPADSLSNQISFNGEGGANAFRVAVGSQIYSSDAVGFGLTYLFGSSRQENAITIDETLFRQSHRLSFSGTIFDIYFHLGRFQSLVKGVSLYGKIRIPLQPVAIKRYSFFPFEDNNGSGYHDRSNIPSEQDFPDPGSVPGPDITVYDNQYKPYAFVLGATKNISAYWVGSGEFNYLQNQGAFDEVLSPLYDNIVHQVGFNLGLSRYGRPVPKEWSDRITVLAGYFYNNYGLENRSRAIIENGIAVGFGFKFGATENKLDFSYQLVNTTGLPGGTTELSNRFAVGISLGDIWFIKRREL